MLGEELQAEQLLHLGPVDLLRPAPVEAIQGFDARQAGRLHPAGHQRRVAACRLAGHQLLEQAAMGPRLARRLRHQVRIVLQEIPQLQPFELLHQDLLSDRHAGHPPRRLAGGPIGRQVRRRQFQVQDILAAQQRSGLGCGSWRPRAWIRWVMYSLLKASNLRASARVTASSPWISARARILRTCDRALPRRSNKPVWYLPPAATGRGSA